MGISFGCYGILHRHHRSPTSATKPAGQDPEARLSPGTLRSTALFALRSQSFLDNLIADFCRSRAS
jgi:hypothetical protein